MSSQPSALLNMINGQIITGDVNDESVLVALSAVAREAFVPEIFKTAAYAEQEVALGSGRFIIKPLVFARMLKHAAITKEQVVLDVGSGSGYSAAVLAQLAQKVVALEEDAALAAKAKTSLAGYGNVESVQGELTKGASKQSPYDVIFVEGAVKFIPQALADQLREGGKLFAVEQAEKASVGNVGLGKLTEFKKIGGKLYKTILSDESASLLPGFVKPSGFVF